MAEQPRAQYPQPVPQPQIPSPHWSTASYASGVSSRSEHAVSSPIGIGQRFGQYPAGAMMSPRSISEQSGIFHQMVENVLASSPASTRSDLRYPSISHKGGVGNVNPIATNQVIASNGEGPLVVSNAQDLPPGAAIPPRTVPISIAQYGGAGLPVSPADVGSTPEQQYPFVVPSQYLVAPSIQTQQSLQQQQPVPQLAATPTSYECYAPWGGIYQTGNGTGVPIADASSLMGPVAAMHGTPPGAMYPSSPRAVFPVAYYPQQPTPQSPLVSAGALTTALSQLSVAGGRGEAQPPGKPVVHTNATFSATAGAVTANGIAMAAANLPPLHPQQPSQPPAQQSYVMMTPPSAPVFFTQQPTRPLFNGAIVAAYPQQQPQQQQPQQQSAIGSGGRRASAAPVLLHRTYIDGSGRMEKSQAPSHSQLLDDFRNSRVPQLQLADLGSQVIEFCTDQHGSRFIQQKLERASDREKDFVFEAIIPHAHALIADVFGNYVVQKLFEFGNAEQKRRLATAIRGNIVTFALQMYGCRVIQKALETLDPPQQQELLKEMEGHILKCIKDQNGNHVVQKIIERVEPSRLQFIIDALVSSETDSGSGSMRPYFSESGSEARGQGSNIPSLSVHPYGCRVVQRVLEHCFDEQKRPVMEELHKCLNVLIVDQYGNYVVQHMIEHGLPTDRDRIIEQIRGSVLKYAQHKFASNVIERSLTCGSIPHKDILIGEVVGDGGPESPLLDMMKDPFANYVVQITGSFFQKMLDVADSANRKKLMLAIKAHIPQLRKYNYGKHIISKLEKYFQKTSNASDFVPDWVSEGQPSMF